MNIRLVLSWLLAVPMFLLLLGGAFLVGGSLILLAFHGLDSEHLFFVAGSFFYLFCAHLLYFGSYFAYPPLYENRLKFISLLLHSKISLLVWGVIYVVTIGYCFHYFKIL